MTILALVLISHVVPAFAASCPDPTPANQPPAAPMPDAQGFNHWGNAWLSAWYEPYHMVQDVLVGQGEFAIMAGKFDYDLTFHKDLEDEDVHVYLYGTGMTEWEYLGEYRTDSDGKIYAALGNRQVGHYQVRMIVEGDNSEAQGFLTVVEPDTKAVLFDIDGTLTLNDFEAVKDYLGIRTARAHAFAPETVRAYADKGYCITYLTARPYWLMKDTREWMTHRSLPLWHIHSNPDGELFTKKDTAQYKTDYLNWLIDGGLNLIRVYGNADTDIEAYQRAGIAKQDTYIIGELAGDDNTQPIIGDYSHHYSTIVLPTPDADE